MRMSVSVVAGLVLGTPMLRGARLPSSGALGSIIEEQNIHLHTEEGSAGRILPFIPSRACSPPRRRSTTLLLSVNSIKAIH